MTDLAYECLYVCVLFWRERESSRWRPWGMQGLYGSPHTLIKAVVRLLLHNYLMAALKKASLSLTDSVWLLRVIFVSKSCLFVFGRTKARLLSTSLRGSVLTGTWSVSFHQLYYWCSFWTTCAVWCPVVIFYLQEVHMIGQGLVM